MLEVIEKLLILQDRDRKILKVRAELDHVPQEKGAIQSKYQAAHEALERAKLKVQKLESERKKLELEVEAKRQLIEKYSFQQFQTKKNEEYRALANEIQNCQRDIREIEDRELELMEKSESASREVQVAKLDDADAKKTSDSRVKDLVERGRNLERELAELCSNREALAAEVEDGIRNRYERLFKSKGSNVVVGIAHGVCGGCHMQLSRQIVVSCQGDQEIMTCPNCGRILYYTSAMDLAVAT